MFGSTFKIDFNIFFFRINPSSIIDFDLNQIVLLQTWLLYTNLPFISPLIMDIWIVGEIVTVIVSCLDFGKNWSSNFCQNHGQT
jgi:hypothetical protein